MRVRGLLPILISFLMLSGCFGAEKADSPVYTEDDYEQERTDLYFLSETDVTLKIDSCPFFAHPTVTEPTYFKAAHIRPNDGMNDENMFEVYEPNDLDGMFVIAHISEEILAESDSVFLMESWYRFFQNQGASGLIFTITHDMDGDEYDDCNDIEYYKAESSDTEFSSSQPIDIPIIQIPPKDMRELNKLAVTGVIIGTDGFELGDVDVLIQASEGNDLSLPNTKISEWVSGHEDCSTNNEGGIVITTKIDQNQDGAYQGSEITQEIECMTSSPYENNIKSVQNEISTESTTSDVCTSLELFSIVTTTEYTNGDVVTETSESKCSGSNAETFEAQLKQILCEDSEVMNEYELDRLSVRECLAPVYESELMQIIPQIKVQSLTNSQMPQCENGGLLIQVWADHDGNGQWSQPETHSSQRLCHGTDGTDGADGIDGLDAYELLMDSTEAGSEMCDSDVGGTEVFIGRDVNQNGVLDDSEIEHSYATCNGEDGSDGQDGTSSIVNITSYSSPSCNGVYVRLANGFDYDGDDTLSTDETLGARYICLPSQQTNTEATFVKETIEPNSVCQNGGVHSYIWIDSNGDDVVQDGDNVSEIFMESFDCAEDDVVVECNDSDGDCISDDEDTDDGNDRENGGDSDFDGVLDEDEHPNCIGQDNRVDSDFDGIPDCEDDDF